MELHPATEPLRNLPKHQKYKTAYKPNDLFWGLGIEHETYLESSQRLTVSREELKARRKAERYCVSYYNVYKPAVLDGLFSLLPPTVEVPILANAHTFQATDLSGEHRTTYERSPKPNPRYSGQSIIEWLKEFNPEYFDAEYEGAYMFDGDTVEFVSQNFYKATVDDAVGELARAELAFEAELGTAMASCSRTPISSHAPFRLATRNWPWATYLTNRENYSMFNNGTLHINITLPTVLDASGAAPADMGRFVVEHREFIRAIQWLEPLLVAVYGSPDPWSTVSDRFAKGSQRVAVSRYIGLGTYDTQTMPRGKILTVKRAPGWMDTFYAQTDYVPLPDVGLDVNFNKHYCHGVELRMLDAMPLVDLADICRTLVSLADYSLAVGSVTDPRPNPVWQGLARRCLLTGPDTVLTREEQTVLTTIFRSGQTVVDGGVPVGIFYKELTAYLAKKYADGVCAGCFLRGEKPRDGPFGLLPGTTVPGAGAVAESRPVPDSQTEMPASQEARAPVAAQPVAQPVAQPEIVPPPASKKLSLWSCMCYCRVASEK